MFRYRDLLAVSFLAIQTALSAVVFPSSSDLPHGVDYDFIIVGGQLFIFGIINKQRTHSILGGTAGGVIASRLGKNPNFKILVIEAGVSYVHHFMISFNIFINVVISEMMTFSQLTSQVFGRPSQWFQA